MQVGRDVSIFKLFNQPLLQLELLKIWLKLLQGMHLLFRYFALFMIFYFFFIIINQTYSPGLPKREKHWCLLLTK